MITFKTRRDSEIDWAKKQLLWTTIISFCMIVTYNPISWGATFMALVMAIALGCFIFTWEMLFPMKP